MMNNELLALVPILSDSYYNAIWLLTQTAMMSSLTLKLRAPAAIPRTSNDIAKLNRKRRSNTIYREIRYHS